MNYCQFLQVIKWYCTMVLKYIILLVQSIGNQYMYGKKQKKVSEYGLNEINKRVLLSVPKLITVGEGTPIPDDVTGVFS